MIRSPEDGLQQLAANYTPLTPISLLLRSAEIYPDKPAVIHGDLVFDYEALERRCRRLASALSGVGVDPGDTVSILAPNVPALLEAHYGVPMCGAVLNALNTRLDSATVGFVLAHAGSKVLIADRIYADIVEGAIARLETPPRLIHIDDPMDQGGRCFGEMSYEELLSSGNPTADWTAPSDEWQAISLSYTSGTTGNPKGVVYHHRGAYLAALSSSLQYRVGDNSVYLWTLPMFHCNGWCFTWAVTAAGGTHVCLRRVEPEAIYGAIEKHRVSHLCGAPVVLNTLINAPDGARRDFPQAVLVITGGAAPPSTVIFEMERLGFTVLHAYGLTESFGPASTCVWKSDWDELDLHERAGKASRQGVRQVTLDGMQIFDLATGHPVPMDGSTIGELRLRGNTVMKGYLKNAEATRQALADGWFHTGDLAVMHPDGYAEIKDRSKDIIISGGENISSLEVEEVLFRHPDVLEAAVVARPDSHWGETPCAFVTLKEGRGTLNAETILAFCRDNLSHYKVPRTIVFSALPKTATGKVQKHVLRERAKELGCTSP